MKTTDFKTVKTWLTGQNILSTLWQILFLFALIPALSASAMGVTVNLAARDVFIPMFGFSNGTKAMAVFMILLPILAWLLITAFRFIKMNDKIKSFIVGGGNALFALLEFIFTLIFLGTATKAIPGIGPSFWIILGLILTILTLLFSVTLILGLFKVDEDLFTTLQGGLSLSNFNIQPKATAFCVKCGAPLKAGVGFCSNCGTPVAPKAPAAPEAPQAVRETVAEAEQTVKQAEAGVREAAETAKAAGFCPKCGAPIVPGTAFCMKCGAPLNQG